MDTELKRAIRLRDTLKGRLTRLKSFVDALPITESEPNDCEIRLRTAEATWNEFIAVQKSIDAIDTSEGDNVNECSLFEETYFYVYSKLQTQIQKERNLQSSNDSHSSRGSSHTENDFPHAETNIKLPTIPLPTFSGDYREFASYAELFDSIIGSNNNIPTIQKFHYLRSSLKGDASALINSLELTTDNYTVALDLLHDRYRNKRIVIQDHLRDLFALAKLDRESAYGLRKLLDGVLKHIRALGSLEQPIDAWDTILIYIITEKLDGSTRRAWETEIAPQTELPTFHALTEFLQKRCKILEVCTGMPIKTTTSQNYPKAKHQFNHARATHNDAPRQVTFATISAKSQQLCKICNESHAMYSCKDFLRLSVSDRGREVERTGVCRNCLSPTHRTRECKSSRSCWKCSKRHHTLLHEEPGSTARPTISTTNTGETNTTGLTVAHCTHNKDSQIMLATAVVNIIDNQGRRIPCRLLLDSASQSNLITESMAQTLGLRKSKCQTTITGINDKAHSFNETLTATVESADSNFQFITSFVIMPRITDNIPSRRVDPVLLHIPPTISLADPAYHTPHRIDALLGAEIFWKLLLPNQLIISEGIPILQNTRLGWIISGKVNVPHTFPTAETHSAQCYLTVETDVNRTLTKFWEIEEVSTRQVPSIEERECEEHFARNVTRATDGRYVVALPLIDDPTVLGKSRDLARYRFHKLEHRLARDPELRKEYCEVMNDYLHQGHMEEVPSERDERPGWYYVPHHPVIKETSTTTKVRVVFDASAKTHTQLALNDILRVGPTIQRDLIQILLSFRFPQHAFTADIKQMYRQVRVTTPDRDLQRIIWRNDPREPLKEYRLTTVTFGTASAPYLAIRTLHQLAQDEAEELPVAARTIMSDFYVDDVITGADNLNDAIEMQQELIELLKRGHFELHKWVANHPALLQRVPTKHHEPTYQPQIDSDPTQVKTLGILWEPIKDIFMFRVALTQRSGPITKRKMLSAIARLFDPLGLVSPVIVQAKLMLQKLWQSQTDWDQEVPADVQEQWDAYESQLPRLDEIEIPRRVMIHSVPAYLELHGFCDASEAAYGGAVYVRSTAPNGQIQSTLLCSKSRIAPLKRQSLPRLELCGAVLLATLVDKVVSTINKTFSSIHLWTDSTVTLAWIRADSSNWKTFVANRVAEIQRLSSVKDWNHVSGVDNPADLLSRGCLPIPLSVNKLWWNGPDWLRENSLPLPLGPRTENPQINCELRKTAPFHVTFTAISGSETLISRYSSLPKLQRVTAYCLRFIDFCRHKDIPDSVTITVSELRRALRTLITVVQTQCFPTEIKALSGNQTVAGSSKLKSLAPFIDQHGQIRVGGRLAQADIPHDKKHPVVLPEKHHLSELIARTIHENYCHAGPQLLLSLMRQGYWPLRGKELVKRTVRHCVKCSRANPVPLTQLMSDLPSDRVNPSRPFLHCGIDYFGPITIRHTLHRKNSNFKAYVALFVCLSTKAIHLELVTNLTSEMFIAALKRFTARRGCPTDVYSDNGTTFVGGQRELSTLRNLARNQREIGTFLADKNIVWHYIPPRSPNFGGLWEAGVKSVKQHVKRTIGATILTYEEFSTLIHEIEACVNSRPITALSNDPSDLIPLTPAHFLIGEPLISLAEPDLSSLRSNSLSRWQQVMRSKQHFWRRWSNEYLATLQQRVKWTKETPPLPIGALVVIKEDFRSPLQWAMGRITEIHPGKDGRCRVVSVRTNAGIVKRAISKICPLPVHAADATDSEDGPDAPSTTADPFTNQAGDDN